jgi:hypothetical protein
MNVQALQKKKAELSAEEKAPKGIALDAYTLNAVQLKSQNKL